MRLISTNVMLVASKIMGIATISENNKIPIFMEEQHLEELRDLLNDYLAIQNQNITPCKCDCDCG